MREPVGEHLKVCSKGGIGWYIALGISDGIRNIIMEVVKGGGGGGGGVCITGMELKAFRTRI